MKQALYRDMNVCVSSFSCTFGDNKAMNTSLSSYARPARPSDAEAIGAIQAHTMRCVLEDLLHRPLADETIHALSPSQFAVQWEETIRAHAPGSAVYIAYDARTSATQEARDAGASSAISPAVSPASSAVISPAIVGFAAGIMSQGEGGAVFVVTAHGFAERISGVEQRREHGARLLAALADYAQKLHARALYVWLFAGDDASIALFSEAGFAPAGAIQSLDVEGTELTQHLWWAQL